VNLGVRQIRLFIRLSRPFFLLGGQLLYALGAAIADYLGRQIDIGLLLIGAAIVLLLQLMTHYLNEYFDAEVDRDNPNRTLLTGGSGAMGAGGLSRRVALYAGIICLGLAATLISGLLTQTRLPLATWLVLLLIFLGAFFYSVPPISLASSGYGELTTAVLVAGLVPAFSFLLQMGDLHRLVLMSTFPLIALLFAMLVAFELPDYGVDQAHDRRNLMVRLGWSTAMRLHDVAILLAVASLAVAIAEGIPRRVGFGALMPLPLAAAQIWQMRRIRNGLPPRWQTLTIGALGLFALTAYLELAGYLLS
jgi:1,4-dihydroxy-2-naphthoate octaprenyltransferase